MSTSPRILVTGAAGRTGSAVVRALLPHADVLVRAMVRSDDARAHRLRADGAEVVTGNFNDVRDLRRAMEGVQRAYFVAPISGSSLDHGLNFAVAAVDARLEHVVALGQWLSSPRHPTVGTRRTWLTDRLLAWMPGVDATLINVGWFADNYMPMLGVAAQLGVFPFPLGRGVTAPIANEDIGRVVAAVLAAPGPYAGRALRPTGPELLSPAEIAAAMGEVLGRRVRYVDISDRLFLKALRATRLASPFLQAHLVHYVREYRRGSFELGAPTDVVREVTGRPAEDFTSTVRRYVAADPATRRTVGNTVRAIRDLARIAVTPPLNVARWERQQHMPEIQDPEDSVDAAEWHRTHARPNAFGVSRRAGGTARAERAAEVRSTRRDARSHDSLPEGAR